MDDLDSAEAWLADGEPDHAMAYIQLWYAKQHREYQQAVAKQRQAQQSMPVPPPVMPYPGAF